MPGLLPPLKPIAMGELMITNPELFQLALFNGLGHAKAFGCGLMLVRRI